MCIYVCIYKRDQQKISFIPLADIVEYHVPGTVLSVKFTNAINEKTYFLRNQSRVIGK